MCRISSNLVRISSNLRRCTTPLSPTSATDHGSASAGAATGGKEEHRQQPPPPLPAPPRRATTTSVAPGSQLHAFRSKRKERLIVRPHCRSSQVHTSFITKSRGCLFYFLKHKLGVLSSVRELSQVLGKHIKQYGVCAKNSDCFLVIQQFTIW